MAAGAATLRLLLADRGSAYGKLEKLGAQLEEGLAGVFAKRELPWSVVRLGSILWLSLQKGEAPRCFESIAPEAAERYARLHRALLERGVYLAPSAYEVMFVSLAHDAESIEATVAAFDEAAGEVGKEVKS
jgi:glutamate-1-semialdehyde 2,1-aminomutase